MTTGQLVFFSGVGLLIVTLVLSIVFAIKKPNYTPKNATHDAAQALYEVHSTADFTAALDETERMEESRTVILSDETELLREESDAP